MRLFNTTALTITLAAFAAGAFATAPASAQSRDGKQAEQSSAPKISLSRSFQKGAVEAQELVKKQDFAGAKAKLDEIQSTATKPDDRYFFGSLLLQVGINQKDEAIQRQALEAMIDSGMTPATEVAKFHYFVGQFAFNAKQYDQARTHFQSAIDGGYGGPTPDVLIANTYFNEAQDQIVNNQFTDAGKAKVEQGLPHLKRAIELQKASGQPVDASWYNKGLSMAVFAKSPTLSDWTKLALPVSGTPDNWALVLRMLQDEYPNATRDESIDIMRLMAATKSLKSAYNYNEYAEAANRLGLPGEVKAVIDQGRSSGVLSGTTLSDLYQVATSGITQDRASLATSEKSAASAATGKPAANTASAFMSYGDNAKAVTLYRLALQKGGVDADEVNTRLGIALARSGDKAGALEAFGKVSGTGVRKRTADLWTVWLNSSNA
ncbi:hypothetical protein [Sphingobium sp. B12D2B]|uniref:hypothetical protein n=1 Tax=Sphingobium sp. B12D2B TaxID=2940577 RepID=UPI00222550EC|nr:hypothetical protein [Sphingobium sp. B12D2B]MCW2350365.1 tetratricopeptide (TPR) repeat protein [Sphingobium sp. B12D2B]